MPNSVCELRPVRSGDAAFLEEVYRMTRWAELVQTGWPDAAKRAFLAQQFHFQSADWDRKYPCVSRDIIWVDGHPAGRLYVDRKADKGDLRVVDIALLPAFRNRGVGTRIFERLFAEADDAGWSVSIHVEQKNPAKRLYERLGFAPKQSHDVYLLMERTAAGCANRT